MSKHKTQIEVPINHKQLARSMADLRYDALGSIVFELAFCLSKDADVDASKNHPKVAKMLTKIAHKLYDCKNDIDELWDLCKPHMKEVINEQSPAQSTSS